MDRRRSATRWWKSSQPERRLIGTRPRRWCAVSRPADDGRLCATVTIPIGAEVRPAGGRAGQAPTARILRNMGTGLGPRITVDPGYRRRRRRLGAFSGEGPKKARAQGSGCLGVITDGSIRDIPQWAPGSRRSAGSSDVSRLGSMREFRRRSPRRRHEGCGSDDLIHADSHGAIVIRTILPRSCRAPKLSAAARIHS